MKKAFYKWMYKPAKPWEFWQPMSGAAGGIALAFLIVGVANFLVFIVKTLCGC